MILSSFMLGPSTCELEGAPSFAQFAKGGFLRSNAANSLLFPSYRLLITVY